MTARIIPFPRKAVLLMSANSGVWHVETPRGLHWRHRAREDAQRHATWLGMRYGLPIRVLTGSTTTTTT
jgi:hypothetical protein